MAGQNSVNKEQGHGQICRQTRDQMDKYVLISFIHSPRTIQTRVAVELELLLWPCRPGVLLAAAVLQIYSLDHLGWTMQAQQAQLASFQSQAPPLIEEHPIPNPSRRPLPPPPSCVPVPWRCALPTALLGGIWGPVIRRRRHLSFPTLRYLVPLSFYRS